MKLTLQLQLVPDAEQRQRLLSTMERFNAAASYAARIGFDAEVFSQPDIHQRCYRDIRDTFGLSAQMAVRAIGKAVECFKRDKKICPVFKPRGAVTYDERILSFKGLDRVSLWSLPGGRMIVPILYGEYQKQRFDRIKGQVDLVYKQGKFFLYATVDLPEGSPVEPSAFLGVDLGIINIATDSDGNVYSGEKVEKVRRRHATTRKRLQKKGSKGAKKLLRKVSGREALFRRHENHCISKALVCACKDTQRGIALEDLKGIRKRVTVRKKQRSRHESWSFAQLRHFVEYKSKLAGVLVVLVDPRNSSRTCSECGHCEKGNRKSQDQFVCLHCDYSTNADFNAARNISGLGGLVNPPQNCRAASAA